MAFLSSSSSLFHGAGVTSRACRQQTTYRSRRCVRKPLTTRDGFFTRVRCSIPGLTDPVGEIWLTLAVMFSASSAGIVLEKTKVGGHVSAPLITMLLTITASNLGVIPTSSPIYDVTNKYLVPLAIPMLLYEANLRKILRTTGSMLRAFFCGAVATVVGTIAAWMFIPLGFGAEDWKIAAGLNARHIGGALNLVAVSEVTNIDPSILTAVIAADNLAVFFYFIWLFFASRRLKRSVEEAVDDANPADQGGNLGERFALAITTSALFCLLSKVISAVAPFPTGIISTSSVLVVSMVTLFPQVFSKLGAPGSIIGVFLLQVFFAASGATGSIAVVLTSAPQLLVWAGFQLCAHFVTLVLLGKLFKLDEAMLYVSSNANVGGPTTAAAMASALNWKDLVVPAILVGILGYATATIISLGLAGFLLRLSATSGALMVR